MRDSWESQLLAGPSGDFFGLLIPGSVAASAGEAEGQSKMESIQCTQLVVAR